MARIYGLGMLAALAACGDAVAPAPLPGLPWFNTGEPVTLAVYFAPAYDCSSEVSYGDPDPDICGDATDTLALRADTVLLSGTFDSVGASILGFSGRAVTTGTFSGCALHPITSCERFDVQDTVTLLVTPSPSSDSLLAQVFFGFTISTGDTARMITAVLVGTPTALSASGGGLPPISEGSWLASRQTAGITWQLCGSC